MGDGRGLAPEAVAALLGDGPHQAVADVVRARLRMVPEGARALAAAEASPGDAQARALLTAAVAQLLASDQAFAQYLATTGLGKPSDPPTVQLRSEPGTVQLRVGPPSAPPPRGPTTVQLRTGPAAAHARALAARRSTTGIVLALALVLIAALVALGVHLNSRPLLKPGGPDLAHAAQPLRNPALVLRLLPDERAVPGDWQVQRGPTAALGTDGERPCLLPDSCDEQLAYGIVAFGSASVQAVEFRVATFASPETAARAFDSALGRTAGTNPTVAVPQIGDQSAIRVQGSVSAVALTRVGSVLLIVREEGPGYQLTVPVLTGLAELVAERARQVQEGHIPDISWATAR
ncbi:hypothetical protein ACFU7Y_23665 [Kitasatospora sp. NPDC057542]|uniref:hypothetical protein n=1 Tax=Streptomycetaceae TaxID=2062 RepID=UPI001CCEBD2E|nr:hypothetical protein [Streptomyces sp. LS1784]